MMLGNNVRMSKFKTGFIDPRANQTRKQMRSHVAKDFSDKSMRWALHMSEEEAAWLEFHNPDTLGLTDPKLRDLAWKAFIVSSDSVPYRIREKI